MEIFDRDVNKLKTSIIAKGRIGIYIPEHPKCNNRGYVLRYRFIMEQSIGRFLDSNELVHHKNGNKLDDRIINLDIMTRSDHAKHHDNFNHKNKLDYSKIKKLRIKGYGYKRMSKVLGYPRSSIQSAIKRNEKVLHKIS